MKVWLLVVNGKVDSVWKSNSGRVSGRMRLLKEVNGSQLAMHLQEKTLEEEEE